MIIRHYKLFLLSLLFLIVPFLQSCDRGTFLRSEKKMEELLQHQWKLEPIALNQFAEEWVFEEGNITRKVIKPDGSVDFTETGTYTFDTGFSKDFLNFAGFNSAIFNTKWQIIDLDDKFFVIAINDDKTVGLLLKEFVRVD